MESSGPDPGSTTFKLGSLGPVTSPLCASRPQVVKPLARISQDPSEDLGVSL